MYIKMGYSRMDADDQIKLIPRLLESLQAKPANQDRLVKCLFIVEKN